MNAQQIAHEYLLSRSDRAVCICDECKCWNDDGVLSERRIAATDAAIKTDAMSASGFDLVDVGNEVFRRAKRIHSDRLSIDVRHNAPRDVCVSAREERRTIHLISEPKRRIKFSVVVSSNCSDCGTGAAA